LVVRLISCYGGVWIAERFVPRHRVGFIDILDEPAKHARYHADGVVRNAILLTKIKGENRCAGASVPLIGGGAR
jgi:hypothetical protein